jgi:hypothetical protein
MTSFDRFAGFGDHGGIPIEKAAPVSRTAKPINRRPRRDDDDDEVIIPAEKGNTMADTDNPFYKMIDREALALQAQTGESYASCFTKCFTDPSNKTIVDQIHYEHLAQSHDNMFGYRLATPVTKAAPPDPPQDFVSRSIEDRGPAHRKLHEMALEHSRQHGLTYEQSYTRLYTSPENIGLKAAIAAEDGVRTLTMEEAMALAPSKEFQSYGHPGDVRGGGRVGHTVGREGRGGQDF